MCGAKPDRQNLHNSHYYRRGIESTRFYPDNCDALCFNCHRRVEKDRPMYTEWKIKRIGAERFEIMKTMSQTITKRNREESLKLAQAYLDSLG